LILIINIAIIVTVYFSMYEKHFLNTYYMERTTLRDSKILLDTDLKIVLFGPSK